MVERLFLAVPRGCLRFLIVVFPDHTHLLFLLNNNLLFVSQLYENKSLVLCAHDLIFFTTGLQTVNYLELIFFFIMAFCSLEGQFESKIESWKIRNSKTRCLAIRVIITVSMLYQFPSGCTADLRICFLYV